MPNVSWEDIGGLENVKRELQEVSALDILLRIYRFYFKNREVEEGVTDRIRAGWLKYG